MGGSHDESLLPLSPHVIGGGLGGGATQRWKLRYGNDWLSSLGKKDLRVKHLRPINPLEEPAPTLLLQN
jgi:hypothetical protein